MDALRPINVDRRTVTSFGEEWQRFSYTDVDTPELRATFDSYFRLFPWPLIGPGSVGADFGCGSGRWARYVAPRVGTLTCVDASEAALRSAVETLKSHGNVRFSHSFIDDGIPIADGSLDFAYSLGVLHHIPDTRAALRSCVRKLRYRAPLLVYLYYALETRPLWYRALWRASDAVRRQVSAMPSKPRHLLTDAIAFTAYWPLSRLARGADQLGLPAAGFPLAAYRDMPMYVLRNDAYDRFSTPLEQRFTRAQVHAMMAYCGLTDISVEGPPYWCAVGYRER